MERRSVLWFKRGVLAVCALVLAGTGGISLAQTPAVGAPNQVSAQVLPPQQLDNLVAPIALYPDPLLGQVLAASTYPVELVEAQQWLQANGNLHGQQLMDAARQQNWDPSVQALVAMPNVMDFLTQDVRWTTDLGNAFLAQQGDVMSAVQRMRLRAQAGGQLKSTPQETVTTENQGGQQAVEIEPANPQEMYVPAYDPYYVYGYGAYPPLYYPDGYWFEPGIDIGFYFGGWGGWGFGGWGWGWGPNWFGRSIFVNGVFFNRYGFHRGLGFSGGVAGRSTWTHDPAHRTGAAYPGGQVSNRFGAASQASRVAAGRAGNWHSFGEGNIGAGNSFRGASPQASVRGSQAFRGPANSANTQRFSSSPQRFSAGAQRFGEPGNRPQAQAPTQRLQQAPQRSAPAFQAPQRSFQSAPRMSAPSFGGGGGGHSVSSGGSHNSGGHGGGRR